MGNELIETIVMKEEFISQQNNSRNKPMVELLKGDVVEKRKDGIFFTRKIDFSSNAIMYETAFEQIKKVNSST